MDNQQEKFIEETTPIIAGGILFIIIFVGLVYVEGLICRSIGFDFIDKTSITYNTLIMGSDTFQFGFIFMIIINLIIARGTTKIIFYGRKK